MNNSSRLGIGTSASLLLLLKYLRNEFDCAVVSDRRSRQLPDALDRLNVHHYALPDRLISYLPSLVRVILQDRYDLVYSNGSNERSRGALWAAKLTRRPLIWHVRESLGRRKYAGTIRFAERVIANSSDTADRLREFADVPDSIVIRNGVDVREFELDRQLARNKLGTLLGLDPDWPRVINVGMICSRKNQADVISVAHRVVAHFPRTYFLLVGAADQEYLAKLKREVGRLGLWRNVLFCDYSPDIADYVCGSDLMLHSASREPQGRVLLEAMAARLPVVAYDVGGVAEAIIQGVTGYLLPFGDSSGLVKAVCWLIGDAKGSRRMGNAGHQHVKENFSAETTATLVREAIRRVLEKRHHVRA